MRQKQTKHKKQNGRPTKLVDDDTQQRILNAIRLGLGIDDAAVYAGINRSTFFRWQAWGEEGKEPYASFCDALKNARIECKMRLLANLERFSENWIVSAWRLERMFPDEFGRHRHQIEMQSDTKASITYLPVEAKEA